MWFTLVGVDNSGHGPDGPYFNPPTSIQQRWPAPCWGFNFLWCQAEGGSTAVTGTAYWLVLPEELRVSGTNKLPYVTVETLRTGVSYCALFDNIFMWCFCGSYSIICCIIFYCVLLVYINWVFLPFWNDVKRIYCCKQVLNCGMMINCLESLLKLDIVNLLYCTVSVCLPLCHYPAVVSSDICLPQPRGMTLPTLKRELTPLSLLCSCFCGRAEVILASGLGFFFCCFSLTTSPPLLSSPLATVVVRISVCL